jgi:hypothetical protein
LVGFTRWPHRLQSSLIFVTGLRGIFADPEHAWIFGPSNKHYREQR